MIRNLVCVIALMLFSLNCFAWYTDAEQAKLQSNKIFNGTLKEALYQITSQRHTPLTYRNARSIILRQLHTISEQGKTWTQDVYCQQLFKTSDSKLTVEHTWPRSLGSSGNKGKIQESDLHHLFPASSIANNKRGNKPFAYIDINESIPNCTESLVGTALYNQHIEAFEPPDSHKGNVARAMFYFATRYKMNIDRDQEEILKEWNAIDPVDDEERLRNDLIEERQGNRNPFIDFPHLTNQISNF